MLQNLLLGLEMSGSVDWFVEQTKFDMCPRTVFYSFHITISFSKAMYGLAYIYSLSPWSTGIFYVP